MITINKLLKPCLLLVMVVLTNNAVAKKKTVVKDYWPNGEPIAEWFSDTAKVDVATLCKR